MARDVEFNVTANDKTGSALASAEAKFKASQKRVEDSQRASLGKVAGGLVDIVAGLSPKLGASLTKAFAGAGDAAGPLIIGGLVASAPLIAATVNTAIAAGISVGVAGIGVALVSQDARVKAAGSRLGKSLLSGLQQDASPFILPVFRAIDAIQAKFDALRPVIRSIFGNAAEFIAPLTAGATRAFDGIVRGVDRLVAKSGPLINALGAAVGDLGQDFGKFIGDINTEAAVASLQALTSTLGGLLKVTGPTLNALAQLYGFIEKYAPSALGLLNKLLDDTDSKTRRTGSGTFGLATAFQAAGEVATNYAAGLDDAKRAVDEVYASNRDLYSSVTDVAGAFAVATKSAKDNGRTLDANSAKGRNNRDALSSVAGALQKNYDAYVKVNGAGAGASKLASTLRGKFVALAEKLGASKTAANRLADGLLNIPNVSRKVNVATQQANAAAEALKRKLAGIKDRSVYVDVAFNQGRINKVEAQLSRLGRTEFDANDSFGMSDRSGGDSARTGGAAAPVTVNQSLSLSLDGAPFKAYTARQIQASTDRQTWRTRVGQR